MRTLFIATILLLFPLVSIAEDKIPIGFILPLSGPWAEYGVAAQNGIALAREERGGALGRVELIFEDDHYDPKAALTAFQHLRAVRNVKATLVFGNESALALAAVAEKTKSPLLAFAQLAEVSRGRKFVIRLLPPMRSLVEPTLRHLRARGFKRFALLKAEASFFNAQGEIFRQLLQPGESLVDTYEFAPGELDFRTAISKMKTGSFDAVGIYLVPTQVAEFYKQASELNARFASFGSTPFESSTVVSQSRGLMHGAVYSHYDTSPEFRQKYLAKYDNDIQLSYAAVVHDVALLLADSLRDIATNASEAELVDAVNHASAKRGATGEFRPVRSEDEGSYLDFPVVLKHVVSDPVK